jgi:hypothetical protein
MRRSWLLLCGGVLFGASAALGADGGARAVKQAVIPGGSTIVVVAEGDFEARSIGSYSVRVYGAANPRFPFDDFIAGTVRPRDGTIDHIGFADLDRDGSPELVVIIRSAGTGAQLSADAFRLRGTVLMLLESVSSLANDTDPIRALETKLAHHAEPRTAPDTDKSRR